MKLADLTESEYQAIAGSSGLRYQTGPFSVSLKTDNLLLLSAFRRIYADIPLLTTEHVCQYHIDIKTQRKKYNPLQSQSVFFIDGIKPFDPYPDDHAFPMLEWGLNWCIGTSANQYLLLHSAVVEKNGLCIILPAMPCSGKSTLSSALALSGWRLLSDEFGMVQHAENEPLCHVTPLPRSIPLKNESIEIIRQFSSDAIMGPIYPNTRKGTVCHLSPPGDSIIRQADTAKARWIVFPRFEKNQKTALEPEDKANAFTRLANNSFNYKVTMEKGFRTLSKLVQTADCYSLPNGNLQEAVDALNELAERDNATE